MNEIDINDIRVMLDSKLGSQSKCVQGFRLGFRRGWLRV